MRAPRASRPRWPRLAPKLVADLLAGHSAVGLALGAAIYLVCLTGTLSVFVDELKLWEAPTPAPALALRPGDLDRAAARAMALAGGPGQAAAIYLRGADNARERPSVDAGKRTYAIVPGGGLVPMRLPWSGFLEALHIDLTLPGPWGEAVVGMLGMGLLSLLVSGVLAHPRILRDAFALRLGGARRLQEADLHNRLGVWGLPFHLAVTASGALFGLANLVVMTVGLLGGPSALALYAPLSGPEPTADARPAPIPPLDLLVARARALIPGSQLYYVGLERPGTLGERVAVEVTAPGRLPRGEDAYFDRTGRMIGRGRYATGGVGMQLYSGAVQVHFGFWGGLSVRLAYGVLGLCLTWVSAGGVSIWLARRRDRGRPAPKLERAWAAWVWGAPAALALAALPLPFLSTPGVCAGVFWALGLLAVLAGQAAQTSVGIEGLERGWRRGLAAALALLAVSTLPRSLRDGTALSVDLAALGGAAALAVAPELYARFRLRG